MVTEKNAIKEVVVDTDDGGNIRISVLGTEVEGISTHTVIAPYQLEGMRPRQVAWLVALKMSECITRWQETNG